MSNEKDSDRTECNECAKSAGKENTRVIHEPPVEARKFYLRCEGIAMVDIARKKNAHWDKPNKSMSSDSFLGPGRATR